MKNKTCWVWLYKVEGETACVGVSPVKPVKASGSWCNTRFTSPHYDDRADTSVCYSFWKKATGMTLDPEAPPVRVRFNVEVLK